ncbi:MAG: glycosyltransferase family 39 protein [Bacteroidales bacterium]
MIGNFFHWRTSLTKSGQGGYLTLPVLFLAIFNIVFHFAFSGNLEYHRDELLYFSLGMHPDFGYSTVPPFIGWVAGLVGSLFGYSVYAVRIVPALLSGAMILLVSAMTKELAGSRYAQLLAAIGLTVSTFFMRSYSLFHPVHLEISLWTLCIFFILRYVNTSRDKYLILLGIFTGVTLLNKYLAIVFFASLLLVVPFSMHRHIFSRKMFWFGLGAGFIVFLPNLIWQFVHGIPSIKHIGELYDTQLVHMDIPLFLSEQFMMPFLGTIFTIAGLVYLFTGEKSKRYRFLGFTVAGVIIILMLLKGKGYYTLGVFPFLISAGAVGWSMLLKKRWSKILFPSLIVLFTLPVVPMGLPVLGKEALKEYFHRLDTRYHIDVGRRFEDGSIHSLPQDYADMIGWEELTLAANKAWQMVIDKEAAFIYAENYGQAGAITVIGKKYGLPQAVCFSESFLYWMPRDFEKEITSMVYINDEPGSDVKALFKKITLVGGITDPDARELGTSVWLCEEPVKSFNSMWKERISSLGRN